LGRGMEGADDGIAENAKKEDNQAEGVQGLFCAQLAELLNSAGDEQPNLFAGDYTKKGMPLDKTEPLLSLSYILNSETLEAAGNRISVPPPPSMVRVCAQRPAGLHDHSYAPLHGGKRGEKDALGFLSDVLNCWKGSTTPTVKGIGSDLGPAEWLPKSYQTLGPQEVMAAGGAHMDPKAFTNSFLWGYYVGRVPLFAIEMACNAMGGDVTHKLEAVDSLGLVGEYLQFWTDKQELEAEVAIAKSREEIKVAARLRKAPALPDTSHITTVSTYSSSHPAQLRRDARFRLPVQVDCMRWVSVY
jgi:hypothetical protein